MTATWYLGTLVSALALLVAGCTTVPSPTPEDYGQRMLSEPLEGERSCGLVMPPGRESKVTRFLPQAGGDLVVLGGPRRLILFDSASPHTIEGHDTIVLRRAHPSGYQFHRVGADLLICSTAYWQAILVIRQYCFDRTATPPWNNQFEEIAFPDARETWLADDIYDSLGESSAFPGFGRVRDVYKMDEEHAAAAAEHWRVRPFREVLPQTMFAAAACDEDLTARTGE